MSLRARILNGWLRWTEKTFLARASDPAALRRSLEFKARLFFHAPVGMAQVWRDLAGAPALRIAPNAGAGPCHILYLHGGGHVFGSPRTHAAMLATLAKRVGATAVLPRYPLSPEAVFPQSLDHSVAAYLALLDEGVAPGDVVIGGDSAGGNLALAVLADVLERGLPKPAGVFCLSPLTDLTASGDSFVTNADADVVLPASRMSEMKEMYLRGHPADDPRASPLFAAYAGAPPVWLAVGDTEILLDDTRRLAERLTAHGVAVDLSVERDLPHVWPLFHNLIPEAKATLDQLAAWIAAQTAANVPTR
ncbi:alpha/beta hydrolase [uncultured Tateyamaria sp.]|uniref:alpha/beta hydrolase n=1 Tax=uncultured Tateyamaria sp. TaxID=455651 RepID=UPI00261859DF|nr:alpha/beta hydrolase [uncultured Tateyamaria sp.]